MNLKKLIPFVAIVLLAISGCKKSGNTSPKPDPKPIPVTLPNVDIYMVGATNAPDNFGTVATYWKNGVATTLSNSGLVANAIALKGPDVFIGGSASSGNYRIACYWKNGVFTKLANGTNNSYVSAITVNGDDVYMAGLSTDNNGQELLTCWKNGIATIYPENDILIKSFDVTGIAVSGNDIYISGIVATYSENTSAAYWKNGVVTQLPDAKLGSTANAIAVSGTDVYVAGSYLAGNADGRAAYWKNGALTSLADSKGACDARAIAINGSDLYISGYTNGVPTYWKNNAPTTLKSGLGFIPGGLANAIVVNNTGVYVASGLDSSSYFTFWFNGQPVQVAKTASLIYGMAVIPR